jgi:hypothetical protein
VKVTFNTYNKSALNSKRIKGITFFLNGKWLSQEVCELAHINKFILGHIAQISVPFPLREKERRGKDCPVFLFSHLVLLKILNPLKNSY